MDEFVEEAGEKWDLFKEGAGAILGGIFGGDDDSGDATPGITGPVESQGAPPPAPGTTGGFGIPRGPDGKWQFPWNDPAIPDYAKPWSIDDSHLRTQYRAPKGYVVVRDKDGQPFGILRKAAIQLGLWKPAKKPPISVREWNALKMSHRVVKKMKRVNKMADGLRLPAKRRAGAACKVVRTTRCAKR